MWGGARCRPDCATATIDRHGIVRNVHVGQRFVAMVHPARLNGRPWWDIVMPADAAKLARVFAGLKENGPAARIGYTMMAQGRSAYRWATVWKTADGEIKILQEQSTRTKRHG